MGITRALAELTVDTPYEALSDSAREATRRLILDTLGTAVAGWREPGIPPVVEQMREWGGREEATLWTYGGRLPAPNAAFANSCMTHALDFDDKEYASGLHIMSSVLPVSLAVGEMKRASGKALLAAVALGVEVAARIAVPAMRLGLTRGFLPSSVVGGFGATASACRLLGLDAEQTVNALGIYYAQTAGNRQALLEYSLTKRMQPAYSARSAVWSTALAARGVTGAQQVLEGKAGFFRVYVGSEPPDLAQVAGQSDTWAVERVWIKQFSSCGGNHRGTQAAITLATEENLRPEDIKEVDLWISENGVWFVGAPFELRRHPQVDAQFSVAHGVALGLVHRAAGPHQYRTETIVSDHVVLDLARRVRIHEIPGTKGKRTDEVPVTLQVTTRDGRTLSRTVLDLKGSPANPMTYEEVADKYRLCADYAAILPPGRAEGIISTVRHLEEVTDVAAFVREMLVVEGAAAS
ncbi:MAG: MmgE/PrpD family protein [Anaerolineae bacterium]